MKEYGTEQIRNVALVAHHGVGKTSLAEAMLFLAKANSRLGRVADGSTMLDYGADEIERQMTINLGLAQFEWQGHKINLIDTPGYLDFVGDVHSALRVADSALLVIRANAGVEVGTEVVWEILKQEKTPTLAVVNMMDKEHASFRNALQSLHDRLGLNAVATQLPIGEAESFGGIVDLIENKAYLFEGRGMEEHSKEVPIPDELATAAAEARAFLMEEAATGDEELMEKFIGRGELSVEDIRKGLCERVVQGDLTPVFCCSAHGNLGVREVLDEVVDVLPSPLDVGTEIARSANGDGEVRCPPDSDQPLAALVYKTLSEQHLGDLSLVRIFSGHLEAGMEAMNTTRGRSEKLGTLYHVIGKERFDCKRASAGDMVAAVKLRETHTGDTLAAKSRPVVLAPPDFPGPATAECIRSKNKGDEEKMVQGLTRLHEEDPTFARVYEPSTHESLVLGMGDLQLEIMVERLRKRFGVDVVLTKPHVPYRETVRGNAQDEYRHKKQTGGRGQFGEVHLRIEPLQRGEGFKFLNEVKGGVIPTQFIPAVEKGVVAGLDRGPVAGYPVVDVQVAVFFGKAHDVDSSEMAFKIAAETCFHQVMLKAGPVLLEPIEEMTVRVPEEFLGDVMGDLSSRRGRILGTEADGHYQEIRATVPAAELYKYSTHLRSLTQGRGMHASTFSHYEEVPRELAERVVAAIRSEKEAGAHAT
ncbi:MAG: translation elongation factor G [Candidatus Eisenbacteria bacterium RBG_16_71_46]|nr:MAG: translation elongation factor G [Candidatus Eisenbacteria bacterium RBG_16_71_46]